MSDPRLNYQVPDLTDTKNSSLRRLCQQNSFGSGPPSRSFAVGSTNQKGLRRGIITYHRFQCSCRKPIIQESWNSQLPPSASEALFYQATVMTGKYRPCTCGKES